MCMHARFSSQTKPNKKRVGKSPILIGKGLVKKYRGGGGPEQRGGGS